MEQEQLINETDTVMEDLAYANNPSLSPKWHPIPYIVHYF
jgi:hypothetical protein